MCNHTSCAQVHELPQSNCGDNGKGKQIVCFYDYIYNIYMCVYIYIYIYMYIYTHISHTVEGYVKQPKYL